MLAGRALLRSFSSLNAGLAVNVARFATTASSAAQAPSPNAQPAIKSTFVTVGAAPLLIYSGAGEKTLAGL